MTRSLALISVLALLGLTACDASPIPTEPDGGIGDGGGLPLPTEPDGGIGDGAGLPDECGRDRLQDFVGQAETAVTAAMFANPVRIIRPGESVTMDYNPQRINFRVGPSGRIEEVTCG